MKDLNHLFGRIPIRTKLLILTTGLATVPLLSFFLLTFYLGFSELRTLSFRNLESDANAIRNQADAFFEKIEQDVRFLSRAPFLLNYIQNIGTGADAHYLREAEENFILLARVNKAYHQLRYIDGSGNEKIRIDQKEGQVWITPRERLQNKQSRYYFRESIALKAGQFYVSPMDYNVEHGAIQMPRLPVFRYAIPVMIGAEPQGILIINIFGRSVLELLELGGNRSFQTLNLLDQKGRVIVSGIEKQGKLDLTLDLESSFDEQPGLLAKLLSLEGPWLSSPKGEFFVHLPISPRGGSPAKYWSLVLKGDRASFVQPFFNFGYYSLGFMVLCGLAAIAVGLLSAGHFYRPLLRLKDGARKVGEGKYDVNIPVRTNDELEDLAQVFASMATALEGREEEIQNHQRELENLVKKRTFQIALEKEKLERVLEGVNAGLGLFDCGKSLIWCNDFFSTLVNSSKDLTGQSCCGLLNGEISYCGGSPEKSGSCAIERAFSGENVELPLQEIECADGNLRTFLDRVSPIRGEEGTILYALHILFDVTEKQHMEHRERQMQQQLVRAEKLATLGRFTAGIAHEIGNPLGIISTNAQAIQEEMEENSPPWKQVELIVSEIHRLSKITKDLNTFGKPSPPALLSHNPVDIIQGLRRMIEKEAQAKGVEVETAIEPCPGTIHVDAQQVQQVILNLVVNAFEAMAGGGRLLLEVKPAQTGAEEPRLHFSVTDSGSGIARESLEVIFDPFYTTKPQGTGFGLSLAHTIVEQNHGLIFVSSVPGKGSTFTISFPIFPQAPSESPDNTINAESGSLTIGESAVVGERLGGKAQGDGEKRMSASSPRDELA